jgi:hypothetical protein
VLTKEEKKEKNRQRGGTKKDYYDMFYKAKQKGRSLPQYMFAGHDWGYYRRVRERERERYSQYTFAGHDWGYGMGLSEV